MYLHLIVILLTFLLNLTSSAQDLPVALKFGDDAKSYILITPDMTPVINGISLCSWVKKVQASARIWIHYRTALAQNALRIQDDLISAYYMGKSPPHKNLKVTVGKWHHVCLTWSYNTHDSILYFDGKNVGAKQNYNVLQPKGQLAIGQRLLSATAPTFSYGRSFGGELLKLNIFKRQLTDDEVSRMYNSGKCSNFEKSLAADTFLSWETLVNGKKNGNVVKDKSTCPPSQAKKEKKKESTEAPVPEINKSCSNPWKSLSLSEYGHAFFCWLLPSD